MKNNNIPLGTLVYQDYKILINNKQILSKSLIPEDSIQPASIDLRLGNIAYEVSSSFLAINEKVSKKINNFKKKEIDISNGYLFKKNKTYIVEIQEYLNLNNNIYGKCNPKSSTGRLDIFCRIITDYNSDYEIIKKGYKGKIHIEITPKTFDIIFTKNDKLSQLRLRNISTLYLNDKKIKDFFSKNPFLFNTNNQLILPTIQNGIKIRVDIPKNKEIIAFKAKKDSPKIYFNKINFYNRKDFWSPIKQNDKTIIIQPNEFYILKSKEKIKINKNLAAEMVPYDTDIGEFRVHYAGFFDPGFGNENSGSHAVLEVKTYELPFALEDGQNIARLIFEKLGHVPSKIYGKSIKSNYQNQSLALSKHFI